MASFARTFKRQLRPSTIGINLALILICLVCLLPVVWSISSSLKNREELYMVTPTLIPRHPTLANYEWMLTRSDMSRLPLNLLNSVKVTMGAVIIQCITATMAGFRLRPAQLPGRDLLFYP